MKDEERSMVFDAHADLRKAYRRFKSDPGVVTRAELEQQFQRLERVDSQLLANMARALKTTEAEPAPRRYWWQRD